MKRQKPAMRDGGQMASGIVLAIGAAIVMAESMITGWLLHRWLIEHAPELTRDMPRDSGAIVGIVVGIWVLSRWL